MQCNLYVLSEKDITAGRREHDHIFSELKRQLQLV